MYPKDRIASAKEFHTSKKYDQESGIHQRAAMNQVKSQMNVKHQSTYNTFNYSTANSGSPQNNGRAQAVAETQRQNPMAQTLNPLYCQNPTSQTLPVSNLQMRNHNTVMTTTASGMHQQVLAENTTINEQQKMNKQNKLVMQVNQYIPHFHRIPARLSQRDLKMFQEDYNPDRFESDVDKERLAKI